MRGALLTLVATALVVPVAYGGAAGSLTATVKKLSATSAEVVITNGDSKPYNDFIIKATDSPKLTAATKPCTVATDTFTSGGKKHTDYRVECKKALAPGRKLAVKLTSSGSGKITVYASVNGVFTQIST